jgi:hypothetical protein
LPNTLMKNQCALTKDRTLNWALTKKSCPDWKHEPTARMLSPDLNEVRVGPHKRSGAELGTHKRSCPDWKHEPAARMLSPGLSEARVQHPTSVGSVSANPNEVRVRLFVAIHSILVADSVREFL